ADRVRKFSITTSADGIVVAAVGGADGLSSANVPSVLLCARLALIAQPAVLDGTPSIEEQALRLQQEGVHRVANSACRIRPAAARRGPARSRRPPRRWARSARRRSARTTT